MSSLPRQPNLISIIDDLETQLKEVKRKLVQVSSAADQSGGGTSGPPLSTSNPESITPGVSASIGTSSSAARSDHIHNITTAAPTSDLSATTTNSEGNASSVSRSNHSHSITTAGPATDLSATTTNSEGNASTLARSNHTHGISTGAPTSDLSATTTNFAGSASSLTRSDHSHAITTAAPTSNLTASTTNSTGSASSLARSDHSHAITTGAPTSNLTATTTNATGSSSSLSRADHSHAITTGVPTVINGLSSSQGSSSSLARADHTHEIASIRCILERTSNQSLASATTTDITYPTELSDLYNFHQASAAAIIIPTGYSGIYVVTATIEYAANNTGIRWIVINKNGSTTDMGSNTSALNTVTRVAVSAIMSLNANDSVTISGLQSSTVSLNVQHSSFSIARVGSI